MASKKETPRYYWLKLMKDFFDDNKIKYILSLPNGANFIVFYLKLCLMGLQSNGRLRFTKEFPYTAEILSSITDLDINLAKQALDLFDSLKIVIRQKDNTLFIPLVVECTGSETKWKWHRAWRLFRN